MPEHQQENKMKTRERVLTHDSGEYEDVDQDGFSWPRGEYTYNWDDSEYRRDKRKNARSRTGGTLSASCLVTLHIQQWRG